MKKIVSIMALSAACLFLYVAEMSAQLRFGPIGGVTFSKLERQSLNRSNVTQYHVGATMQLKLPLGFSVQPSLIYQVKGARLAGTPETAGNVDLSVGYLELPVSVQWGPDLLLFRPFLDITPYIGYGLNNNVSISGLIDEFSLSRNNIWESAALNRFEYGLGIGVGLEIWKFQVIGRYNWNLGPLSKAKSDMSGNVADIVKNTFDKGNFGGFTLTAAILF